MNHQSNPLKAATPFSRRKMLGLGSLMLLSGAATGCSGILPGQGPPSALYRLTPKSTFRPDLPEVDWQLVVETPVSNASLNTTRIALQRAAVSTASKSHSSPTPEPKSVWSSVTSSTSSAFLKPLF